uniref:Uncharacterized protein n=1 Tax=Ananas comosus var. bracteatus TaxID=296719 RepID=A0A6V7PS50_ANACO|nr:unnamed protein product [Ananas comosus var. bracteatus]
MEKASSLLFAGTHFDRKRFGSDIARFKPKEPPPPPPPEDARKGEAEPPGSPEKKEKKRKRKGKSSVSAEIVEGFSVFGCSESVSSVRNPSSGEADGSNTHRKEVAMAREIERASILWKKHGIHISGYNVPAPLESFEELSSRFTRERRGGARKGRSSVDSALPQRPELAVPVDIA